MQEDLKRELRIIQALHEWHPNSTKRRFHPSIVRFLGLTPKNSEKHDLALEFVPGKSLNDLFDDDKPERLPRAVHTKAFFSRVLLQVSIGLNSRFIRLVNVSR